MKTKNGFGDTGKMIQWVGMILIALQRDVPIY